jgi:hypothetical protein
MRSLLFFAGDAFERRAPAVKRDDRPSVPTPGLQQVLTTRMIA